MKLSGKLSLSMGVLTAVLILLGVFCLYQMDRINDTAIVLADRHVPALTYIAEADKLASDYRIVEVMHIYETDSAKMDVLAKSMNDITARLDTVLDKYRAIPRRPLGDQLLQQYDRDRAAFQKIHQKIFTLSQNNATAEAIRILTTESQDLYNKMSASLEKLVDMIEKCLDKGKRKVVLRLPYAKGGLLDTLHSEAQVLRVDYSSEWIEVEAVVNPDLYGRVRAYLAPVET